MNTEPEFLTWDANDEAGKRAVFAKSSAAFARLAPIERTTASTAYRNVGQGNVSVRDGIDRTDVDYFRPGEEIPTRDEDIIAASMQGYKRFPIVRSIVDLMSDFAVKGIDIAHPSKSAENFGKHWFKKVNGVERSERIANMVFKSANAVIQRQTAKLPKTTLTALGIQEAKAADKYKLPPGEIPMGYKVLDPRTLRVIGGPFSPLVNQPFRYAVRVPRSLTERLSQTDDDLDKEFFQATPTFLRKFGKEIKLDPAKTVTVFYKKDDFQVWATPILYTLLDDLQTLNKLRLADRAALDGAISHVRLWRLGSLEHRIMPNDAAVNRLAEMLMNNSGGGALDLIWGPDLTLEETTTDIHQFLGQEKYVPTLASIYQGLGVPPALNGMGGDTGFTNSLVSLRVLMERLEYVRGLIKKFWEDELRIIQETFHFREEFAVTFDHPSLSDDAAELRLLIELVDRNIISAEYVQEQYGAVPEIENMRLRREEKLRKKGKLPPKAGPFHEDSRQEAILKRNALMQGGVTPSEVGLELEERKKGEVPFVEYQADIQSQYAPEDTAPSADTGGRPNGVTDTGKRKKKSVKPSSKAFELAKAIVWAEVTQAAVEEHLRPAMLAARGKKNLRSLSIAEAEHYEQMKFGLLCQYQLGETVTAESVGEKLKSPLVVPKLVRQLYQQNVDGYAAEMGCSPSVEKARQIQAAVYAVYCAEQSETEG